MYTSSMLQSLWCHEMSVAWSLPPTNPLPLPPINMLQAMERWVGALEVVCRVGEHQHRWGHQCSPCEKFDDICSVKLMGYGNGPFWLMSGAIITYRVGDLWVKWVGQLWQSKFRLEICSKTAGLQGSTLSDHWMTTGFGPFELPT